MDKLSILVLLVALAHLSTQDECSAGVHVTVRSQKWSDMPESCFKNISTHIQNELKASLTYLAMGAHFSQDMHWRPNMAHKFLESASEERTHARMMMDYLLMRGGELDKTVIPTLNPDKTSWTSLTEAVKHALQLEIRVRDNISNIVIACEKGSEDTNDFHAVDYLTGTFLDEQHKSIREWGGYYANLQRMQDQYGDFAEIMFDHSLQK